jgi:hypothetical protein
LETLTIIFYAFSDIKDGASLKKFCLPPVLIKLQRGTKHGRRADWLHHSALKSLAAARENQMLEWRVPKIEVLVWGIVDEHRENCDDFENYIMEEWTEEEVEDEDKDDSNDDSTWYQQAARRMTHTVPKSLIGRLKRRHHPSRKRGLKSDFLLGEQNPDSPERKNRNMFGTYITDSEAEAGEREAL